MRLHRETGTCLGVVSGNKWEIMLLNGGFDPIVSFAAKLVRVLDPTL